MSEPVTLIESQWEMAVLLDALHGSLSVSDRANIWRWSEEQRRGVLDRIYERMSECPVSPPLGAFGTPTEKKTADEGENL